MINETGEDMAKLTERFLSIFVPLLSQLYYYRSRLSAGREVIAGNSRENGNNVHGNFCPGVTSDTNCSVGDFLGG